MIIAYNTSDDQTLSGGSCSDTDEKDSGENSGTVILNATYALQKIFGLITNGLDKTTRSSIALSVIAMHVDRMSRFLLRLLFLISFF